VRPPFGARGSAFWAGFKLIGVLGGRAPGDSHLHVVSHRSSRLPIRHRPTYVEHEAATGLWHLGLGGVEAVDLCGLWGSEPVLL
jgi:hypothetical protein